MGLTLTEPRPPAMPMPPPRLTSYRYWEDWQPEYFHAIHATLTRVIDEKERQGDLFTPPRGSGDRRHAFPRPEHIRHSDTRLLRGALGAARPARAIPMRPRGSRAITRRKTTGSLAPAVPR